MMYYFNLVVCGIWILAASVELISKQSVTLDFKLDLLLAGLFFVFLHLDALKERNNT